MLFEVYLKRIVNGQNVLKKLHYLPLGKVCALYLQLRWFMEESLMQLQFEINLPTIFVTDLSHQLRDWPNIPEDLTNPNHDYGLNLLSELLRESGKTIGQCGLPLPNFTWRLDNSLLRRELDYDPMYEALLEAEKAATFNIEQRECFERVISAVDSVREGTRPYFFIQGPAGTGKTFLYSVLCHHYCWKCSHTVSAYC